MRNVTNIAGNFPATLVLQPTESSSGRAPNRTDERPIRPDSADHLSSSSTQNSDSSNYRNLRWFASVAGRHI